VKEIEKERQKDYGKMISTVSKASCLITTNPLTI
jgi:hypothetical protein